jgi:hypothetical protein
MHALLQSFEIKKGLQPGGDVTVFVRAVEKVNDAKDYLSSKPQFKSTGMMFQVLNMGLSGR